MSGKPGRPAIPKTPCSVAGCETLGYSKGMCKKHYNRMWKHGDVNAGEFKQRFESNIRRGDSCWIWTGYISKSGYGRASRHQKKMRAHRAAFELYVGPIPDGMHVLHRCDNPPCVNPSHLFLGTHIDNMRDMEAKGRAKWIQENLRRKT